MSKEIVVVETIRAMSGRKQELKEVLAQIVPTSRKARGCLQYDLLKPIEESDEFLVLMRWKTLDDLRRHEASDYIEEFVKKYDRILYDEVKVTEYDQLL